MGTSSSGSGASARLRAPSGCAGEEHGHEGRLGVGRAGARSRSRARRRAAARSAAPPCGHEESGRQRHRLHNGSRVEPLAVRPPSTSMLSGRGHTPSRHSAGTAHVAATHGSRSARGRGRGSATTVRDAPRAAPGAPHGVRLASCSRWRRTERAPGRRASASVAPELTGSGEMRWSATPSRPGGDPKRPHHRTRSCPVARPERRPSRRLAMTERAESGRPARTGMFSV